MVLAPALLPLDKAHGNSPIKVNWTPQALEDPVFLHATLLLSAVHIDILRGG